MKYWKYLIPGILKIKNKWYCCQDKKKEKDYISNKHLITTKMKTLIQKSME